MKKKTQKPQVSEEELMTREQQLDLSSKIQIIVEKEIGSNFSFKNEGPNKSVMLKISKDKKASIDDVRYLLGHDLKIKEHDSKKNHG